jgi:hypothetical protein
MFVHAGSSIWTQCTRSQRSCPRTARRLAWCARPGRLRFQAVVLSRTLLLRASLSHADSVLACTHSALRTMLRHAAGTQALQRFHESNVLAAKISEVFRPKWWSRHQHAGLLSSPSFRTARA